MTNDVAIPPSFLPRQGDKKAEDGSGGAASFFPMMGLLEGKEEEEERADTNITRGLRPPPRMQLSPLRKPTFGWPNTRGRKRAERGVARLKARVEVVKLMMSRDVGKIYDAL